MNVTSNAFVNKGMIPRTYTGFGKDISPDSNKRQLLRAMADHIIDSVEIIGIYKRGN